jgi:predicted lipoprotein with Yx(FWY)xxD motif
MAMTAAACSSGHSGASSNGTDATLTVPTSISRPPTTSFPGATAETLPSGTAAISVLGTNLGDVLVDGLDGRTLYAFQADGHDHPTCVGACAQVWVPVTGTQLGVSSAIDYQPGEFKLVARPGGGPKQVSVAGHPLYRYSGDQLAGQTKGQGVQGRWWAVSPDGTLITRKA